PGNSSVNLPHNLLSFVRSPVHHQPARTFRNPLSKKHDDQSKDRTDPEDKPPAEPDRKQIGVEKHHGCSRAERRADPVTAVDNEIDATAHSRRNKLIDG